MAKYRVGFAGLIHDHVWNEIAHWKRIPDAELVAAGDRNQPLLLKAEQEGIQRMYGSWQEMLDTEDLNVLEVALDNAGAVDVVEAGAARGLAVKVEKPMAARLDQAERMLAAAQKAGTILMINWPTTWNPADDFVLTMIKRGDLGQPFYFRLRCAHNGPKEIGCSRYFWEWLYDAERCGAGALMDYCCYGANMCSYLFGLPKSVVGVRAVLAKEYPVPDDNATIIMQYDKLFGVSEASWTEPVAAGQPNPFCLASEGNIGVVGDEVVIQRRGKDAERITPPALPEHRSCGPRYLLHCLKTGALVEGPSDPSVGRNAQEILEAGLLSTNEGRRIELPLPS
jgi:predicted dehydrogenase